MSVIRRNVIANIFARAWTALLALAVVPIYLRIIGVEAYGLTGFFLSISAVFSLLDFGLGAALNRQFAHHSAGAATTQEMRDLLRTLEVIYWPVGLLIGGSIALLAPWIAAEWLRSDRLPQETVVQVLTLMGAGVAVQWPRGLYTAGLTGLQRQVALNALSCATGTLSSVGGALVLIFVSPTIQALFSWIVGVSILETACTALLAWRAIGQPRTTPRIRPGALRPLWRYAIGMAGIAVLSVLLTHLDKVVLSKTLTLEMFGYYSIAWRVASTLYFVVSPVTTAFLPRLTQLAAGERGDELARLYHQGCQLVSALLLPVSALFVVCAFDILLLWTKDPAVAANTAVILKLLAVGTTISGLLGMPLTLQYAHAWTRLTLVIGTVAAVCMTPVIYFASRHGAGGAAAAWLLLNCAYLASVTTLMHRRLLRGHLRRWFTIDVGVPLVAAALPVVLWKMFALGAHSRALMALQLGGVLAASVLAAFAAAPLVRRAALDFWTSRLARS